MELVELKCTQCGASLPPQAEGGVYRCTYCGRAYEPVAEQAPQVVQVQIQMPVQRYQARIGGGRSSSAARGIGCLVPILFAAGGFVAFQTMRTASTSSTKGRSIPTPSFLAPHERMYWDSVGGAPQPATIGGAPAAIGRVRMGKDELYVVAFNPATTELLWKVGPLGTYSQGYRATFFAALGDRVAVSDYRSKVHLVDTQTGMEVSQVTLTDHVDRLCPVGPTTVYVGTVDKRGAVLDTHTGATHAGTAPAGCEDGALARFRHDAPGKSPKVPGFATRHTVVNGDIAVAAGGKSPGTEIPMAVGFDPKTSAVRWTVVLAQADPSLVRPRSNEHDALAPGMYVTMYGVGDKAWHITALEPRSGARIWDTELRKIFAVDSIDGIVAGGGWVYVTRTSSLAILNGTTGKITGAIGDETYE